MSLHIALLPRLAYAQSMKWIWLITGLILACSASAEIYRWVDDNGDVVYSDQPHPNAETVDLPPSSAYTPPEDIKDGFDTDSDENKPKITVVYELRVISPADDESLWINNGDVPVTLSMDPPLAIEQGDQVVVTLDGTQMGEPQSSTTLQLQNLSRGTHSLSAYVVSADGTQLSESRSVTFHLHRASAINNPNNQGNPGNPPANNTP